MDKVRLKQLVLENQEELLELCSELLKINSENPTGDTTSITKFICNYLNENDIQTEVYEADNNRFNIVASIGKSDGKELIYCGHSDTVPVGDIEKWSFSPFSGDIVDGYMQGRGASDMKAGLGGLLFTAVLLQREQIELSGKLTIAVVPDEESGGEYGVPWLLGRDLIRGDGCLIAEPSSKLNPTLGQKGSCWFTLIVNGIPGHGSLAPYSGKNAIVDAIKAIEHIRTVTDIDINIPSELTDLIALSKQYITKERENSSPEIFERITCNIGTIHGGTSSNVVADKCIVDIDCRLPFGTTYDETMMYIKEGLDKLDIDYKIESFGFKSSANYTPADDPICNAIVENIKYITDEDAYGVLQWACSDARHFREYGIPVLQYGPAELDTIHGIDERVKVEDIIRCAQVYVLTAVEFLS